MREKKTLAMTAGQFFLYLLIIIILRESLASAAPPTLEASADSFSVSTIPAVNMEASHRVSGFETMEDHIEGAEDCEPGPHIQSFENQLKCTSPSLRIDFRGLSWSSPTPL